MADNFLEVFTVGVKGFICVVCMAAGLVYDFRKQDLVIEIGLASDFVFANRATTMLYEGLAVRMAAENNELQLVVTSFGHVISDGKVEKVGLFEDVLGNLLNFSIGYEELHI